ncbi:PEP-CTERM sorting domain-containing protein [Methylomonas sp. MK1]|uniref:PEP-CTERM sorting domain-containing protein n=1 Tax=Methylomonas sp. MK1 TaxID=1131552 RepID=UPI000366C310|nr:PEP-CTERM sorting domain-containing protein [Methylomonas sp. MK1]
MLRKILSAAVLMAAGVNAHAALSTGDIAFTSFNADEDGFSFVTFVDLGANTVIHFNDNEWNGSAIGAGGAFNTGEGIMSWNSGASTIAAGTVVRFSKYDQLSRSVSAGSLFGASGDNGMNATNETIYALLGSTANAPTTFLAAVSNGGFGSNGTLTNTGLAVGTSAVQLNSSTDYAEYSGVRSGKTTFAEYKTLVNTNANWTNLGDGTFAAQVPNTTNFTVTAAPVPVPGAVWLFGSALLGFLGVRRKA